MEPLQVFPQHQVVKASSHPLKRFAFSVVPRHTLRPFLDELTLARVRWATRNTPRRFRNARHLRLNLGVGGSGRAGWLNVDSAPYPGVNCLYDCRTRLPFPDASARCIFTEHFFEHLDYTEEVPLFLTECRRVLEPDGVIRIVVPDAEIALRAYTAGGWDPFVPAAIDGNRRAVGYGFPYNTRMEIVNHLFRQGNEHKYAYDFETLGFLLQAVGFTDVRRQEFGVSQQHGLAIDQAWRAPGSLYVEATK